MIDSTKVGRYKDRDVYLIEKGGQYFISFGSVESHHYWLEALNRILEKNPDYRFRAISNTGEFDASIFELRPLIEEINKFIRIIAA